MANGYSPELLDLLDSLFGADVPKYLEQTGVKLPPTFRFNPLKHSPAFEKEILRREGLAITPAGLSGAFRTQDPAAPIGKSLSHFLGHIYIQDLASMVPPLLLDPQPGETILDLCASPGSKTSQMSAMMANRGLIVANDVSVRRIRGLVFNLRRVGTVNTLILKGFGEQYGNQYFETFDRVLLDPPCTALGTVHKSPRVLDWWRPHKTERYAHQQLGLMNSALKALKPGGVLVYSTCTVHPEENEAVIDHTLKTFPVEIEEFEVPGLVTRPGLTHFGSQVFDTRVSRCRRIVPFENECEGFFIAKIRKTGSFSKGRIRRPREMSVQHLSRQAPEVSWHLDFLNGLYEFPESLWADHRYWLGIELSVSPPEIEGFPLYQTPVSAGLPLAHLNARMIKLTTEGAHLIGQEARYGTWALDSPAELEDFVNRRDLSCGLPDAHQVLATFDGMAIGHGIVDGGRLLSRFPRIGWPFRLSHE